MGHARAIITLPEDVQLSLAEKAMDKGWSVREMEQAVQNVLVPAKLKRAPKPELPKIFQQHQADLAERMNTKVKIAHGAKGRGKIEISYASEDELERLLKTLKS